MPTRRSACDLLQIVTRLFLVSSLQAAWALDPNALPTGGTVVGGSAAISPTSTNRLDVRQSSQRTAIDWQTFNIGAAAQVNFIQPNASAVALNRVLNGNASEIAGSITANGQVFLVNPAGVLFSKTGQVSVGGLVASTLDIAPADFMAGMATFSKTGTAGSVVNRGALTADAGGYIALLAPEVRNEGHITATLGTVAFGAGDRVTLDFVGDRLLNLRVDTSAVNSAIANRQLIVADGGQVIMSARAAGDIAASVVNNEGIIQARSLSESNGVIRLEGAQTVSNGGTIDASGAGAAAGGAVSISAHDVLNTGRIAVSSEAAAAGAVTLAADGGGQLLSGAIIATGQSGGSVRILGGALTLAAANVNASGANAGGTILVGGDYHGSDRSIRNADTVRVDAASTLDVSATEAGNAGRAIVWSERDTRFAGTALARGGAQGGNGGFVEVSSREQLSFAGDVNAGAPAGAAGTLLLDPKNIVININGPGAASQTFAANPAGNVTVSTGAITAITRRGTAVILRANNDITLAAGAPITTVAGGAGGAVTLQAGRSILLNSSVTTDNGALTLVANETSANGVVTANRDAGAAVITQAVGTTLNAGTGAVSITLANGAGRTGARAQSGNVTLAGVTGGAVSITNSGPTAGSGIVFGGNVNARSLTARAATGGIALNSRVTLATSGAGNSLVLAGTGFTNSAGASALSAPGGRWLVYSANPANDNRGGLAFDFKRYNCTFAVAAGACGNAGAPSVPGAGNGFLYSLAPALAVTADAKTKTYGDADLALTFGATGFIDGDTVGSALTGAPARVTGATSGSGKEVVGTYAINQGTVASSLGYQINYTGANYVVAARAISGGVTANDKTYDASTAATINSRTLSGVLAGDTVAYTGGTVSFDTKNVGSGKTVTATGLSLSGVDAGNYTVNSSATTTANITPAPLTVHADDASRLPNTPNPTFTATGNGFVAGESFADLTGTLQFSTPGDEPERKASRAGSMSLSIRDGGIRLPIGHPKNRISRNRS